MSNNTYSGMTDDALTDIKDAVIEELKRRKAEPKIPVFIVDGVAYKNIDEALIELIKDIEICLKHKDGSLKYFAEAIDDNRPVLGMTFDHWSESEYNARPDKVYGY